MQVFDFEALGKPQLSVKIDCTPAQTVDERWRVSVPRVASGCFRVVRFDMRWNPSDKCPAFVAHFGAPVAATVARSASSVCIFVHSFRLWRPRCQRPLRAYGQRALVYGLHVCNWASREGKSLCRGKIGHGRTPREGDSSKKDRIWRQFQRLAAQVVVSILVCLGGTMVLLSSRSCCICQYSTSELVI